MHEIHHTLLQELTALQEQIESTHQALKAIEQKITQSGQSLEVLHHQYQNQMRLVQEKRVNDAILQQLSNLREQFANVQSGAIWLSMQMAVFFSLLERVARLVKTEHEAIEAKKRQEKDLTQSLTLRHRKEREAYDKALREEQADQQRRTQEMAEKARIYPFHLTPTRIYPY